MRAVLRREREGAEHAPHVELTVVNLPAIESTTLPLNPRAIGTWTREALLADHQKAQDQKVVLVAG